MKLIIDIDEKTYNDIQSRDWKNGELVFSEEWKAIHNGIPFDNLRAEIKEAKTVRVTTDDTMIESNIDAVINPQYKNFTSGLDMAIYIIDKYITERNK